jgi:hypothetical protein
MSEAQHSYTPVYPDVAIQSHDPPCAWCGGEVKPHFAASDLDLCTVCATPRVRPTAKPAAAASRHTSLIGFVDDLLDLLQEVGGMSAEWCETKLQEYEALLKGQ